MAVTEGDLFGMLYLIKKFNGIDGRKKFQKLVVLAKLEKKYNFSFQFDRHLFGPYSIDLQRCLNNLVSDGIVSEKKDDLNYAYNITPLGEQILESLKTKFSLEDIKKLDAIHDENKALSTPGIVARAKVAFGW